MGIGEAAYYFVANIITVVPIFYLLMRKGIIYIPVLIYLFFVWLFLVAGIPLVNDVLVLGNYSFSYSLSYLVALLMMVFPVIMFCVVANGKERKDQLIRTLDTRGALGFFYLLWIASSLGVFAYVSLFGLPPLFDSLGLSGRSSDLYSLRMSVTYGDDYKRYDVFFILLPGIATLLGAFLYKVTIFPKSVFWASVFIYCLLSFSFLHKSHMVVFILSLFLIFYFFSRKTVAQVFILPFFVSLGLLLATYVFYIGVEKYSLIELLAMIFQRVLVPYITSLDFVLNNFGSEIPFLMGASLPNPKGLFEFETVYLSNLLMNLIAGKPDGTVPAPSVGFLYANFGFIGLLLNSIIVFSYFILLHLILKKNRNPLGFVIWVYLAVSTYSFSVRDPFGVIDFWVFAVLFLYFVWKMILNVYKKSSECCSQ